jgi:hypothetical protein
MPAVFDQFMARTLPLWLAASAVLPLVIAYFLFKAAFRIRELRSLLDEAALRSALRTPSEEPAGVHAEESEDWVASPDRRR